MAEQKQIIVEANVPSQKQMGARNESNMRSIFSASPIYKGVITDNERTVSYQQLALDGDINDDVKSAGEIVKGAPGLGFNSFNRDYVDAPDLSEVETGGGGLPASPYMPNPASPGPGSVNAADQPEYNGEIPNMKSNVEFGSGLGGTVSPSVTSEQISEQSILKTYISGKSYLGSDGSS